MTADSPFNVGSVDLGELRRLGPVSWEWGWDRGTPIDRHYIERFLEDRAAVIRGRVLEFGEPYYTKMFGGDRVDRSDLLNVMGGPTAAYTCSLEEGDELPTDSFDCVICAQTLQYIYNVCDALRTLHRILKPGGSLLLTVPGIIPTHPEPWPRYWSFTPSSIDALCGEFFDRDTLDTAVSGNVLAAAAFLYGLADTELTKEELDHFDPAYVVTIGVNAVK